MSENTPESPQFEPLLTPEDFTKPARRPLLARPRVPARVYRLRDWMGTPRGRKTSIIIGAVLVVGTGIGLWLTLRPTPQPDYVFDDLDVVFDYTLLSSDFNSLPIDERLELVGQLVSRLGSMSASDSAMLAAFAAGVAGEARDQIEENMSRLAIDLWDDYAMKCDDVGVESRPEYLEDIYLNMVRVTEGMVGGSGTKSDDELLEEARVQAQRDVKWLSNPKTRPDGNDVGMMFRIMNYDVGQHATPHQRARGALLMRDMVRHFRGGG